MKRFWKEGIIHLLFWLSTAWLITSSFSIEAHEIELKDGVETVSIVRNYGAIYQLLFCVLISLFAFYINARLIFRLNQTRQGRTYVLYSALTFLLAFSFIYLFTQFRFFMEGPPIPKQISLGIVVFYFALSIAYGLAKLWMHNMQRQQQLMLEKKQAELSLLRHQLQPHFLFNVLNNLLSMVDPLKNPKLIHSFEQLSQLLRYVVEGSNIEKVGIKKEIEFLKNYIELQMLRFEEDEVKVHFVVRGEEDAQLLEPGLFIAFIENAFKYGTEPETTAVIDVLFDLSDPQAIYFELINKVMMKNSGGTGTGIEATKKRLELIYPGQHQLSISEDEYFTVKLTLSTS